MGAPLRLHTSRFTLAFARLTQLVRLLVEHALRLSQLRLECLHARRLRVAIGHQLLDEILERLVLVDLDVQDREDLNSTHTQCTRLGEKRVHRMDLRGRALCVSRRDSP